MTGTVLPTEKGRPPLGAVRMSQLVSRPGAAGAKNVDFFLENLLNVQYWQLVHNLFPTLRQLNSAQKPPTVASGSDVSKSLPAPVLRRPPTWTPDVSRCQGLDGRPRSSVHFLSRSKFIQKRSHVGTFCWYFPLIISKGITYKYCG